MQGSTDEKNSGVIIGIIMGLIPGYVDLWARAKCELNLRNLKYFYVPRVLLELCTCPRYLSNTLITVPYNQAKPNFSTWVFMNC